NGGALIERAIDDARARRVHLMGAEGQQIGVKLRRLVAPGVLLRELRLAGLAHVDWHGPAKASVAETLERNREMDVARIGAGGDDDRRRLAARLLNAVNHLRPNGGCVPIEGQESNVGRPHAWIGERLAMASTKARLCRL